MKSATKLLRGVCAGLAVVLTAACDDDGGIVGGDRLSPDELSDRYMVCQLAFDPGGSTLPTVDIRAAAFELGDPATDPVIAFDADPQIFELTYVPSGQLTDRELRGTYQTRADDLVDLRFDNSGVSPTPLLLPSSRSVQFQFQESPKALILAASTQYNVSRDDYVALSGSDPAGLADQIPGVLVARFQRGGC